MIVLAINCGSSSLKFRLVAVEGGTRALGGGLVERIGGDAVLRFDVAGRPPVRESAPVADHDVAVRRVVDWIRAGGIGFDAVGHRVVHGGARFVAPAPVDAALAGAIEELEELAPLHNGPSLAGIRACRAALGERVPMVAVFDTAFHASLPEAAFSYGLPHELARRHGVRRFGFHGLSYQWVVTCYAELAGLAESDVTLVALHLGNGASAAAIRHGRSVDTSMGFTPLEGLLMGTRSGDLDPALVGYLARREGVDTAEIERVLNEESGLLGLSGKSRDMRDLIAARATDPRARLAVDVFCHRARKYLGAYLAVLGGARAVVFTGGIGEHAAEVRAEICRDAAWCGLTLDPRLNRETMDRPRRISTPDARVEAWVIPADEERVVARETARCLAAR
ncbi:MAG TPA: acetate kinase [Methylomirabilota bacterium]|nr:acetate kinase [Methylomirabilota bacterium]